MKEFVWVRALLICSQLCVGVQAKSFPTPVNTDWYKTAGDELKDALKTKQIIGKAKNVVLFIGDGMGYETVAAARIYKGQREKGQSGEETYLEFEKLPFTGTAKTYSIDGQIPESAATGTAILTGRKVNANTLGVTDKIKYNVCGDQKGESIKTILEMAEEAGKDNKFVQFFTQGMATGIVTTARITHATPAASYAHSASRYWEDDEDVLLNEAKNYDSSRCPDNARQLVEEHPYINVLLGGGRRGLLPKNVTDPDDLYGSGSRLDGRNLIHEWINEKSNRNVKHEYVWNKDQFDAVDPANTDYLLGLFDASHMEFEIERSDNNQPSLSDMTRKAIQILKKEENGFFLLVEGARIDHAHHWNRAGLALQETVALDEAVETAMSMTNSGDTLTIVTADHSHSMTAGGWSLRGNDILGVDNSPFGRDIQGLPILTLAYHNGLGYNEDFTRRDHRGVDTSQPYFVQDSLYPMGTATHSLFDVPIYALGPFAHLFNGIHEQHYIAHVMAYATCIGDNKFAKYCDTRKFKKGQKKQKG